MPLRILVVDDDDRTVETVSMYLSHAGFDVVTCGDGKRALELVREQPPALVVLDLMLPGASGFDVCRELRRESAVPIVMLTARATEDDTLQGLGIGADDYLTKPFSPRELVARVHAVLRRHGVAGVQRAGAIQIDRDRRTVTVGIRAVELTATEFDLLSLLVRSPGRVFSRGQLVDHLRQGGEDVLERTVDAHIMNLRRKIEDDRAKPRYLVTVYGVGYRFDDKAADA
ncbi:MAG: response regulator transcription factor [Vicinamibacterales bacterium]